jgi:nucleotide-binding universal stress UspA family protein
MINRILVATDASAASSRALEMAAQIAKQYKADLLIIHVIRDMQIPFEIKEIPELESDTIESFATARDEIMRKVAESVLRDAKQKAEKIGASKVQTTIGTGDPATSILDVAKRRKADMIVIGTRGLGKIQGQILGSVSRKVTNNAETSCLIVR